MYAVFVFHIEFFFVVIHINAYLCCKINLFWSSFFALFHCFEVRLMIPFYLLHEELMIHARKTKAEKYMLTIRMHALTQLIKFFFNQSRVNSFRFSLLYL